MKIKIKKLHPDAVIPTYGTDGAAAFDLYTIKDYFIMPKDDVRFISTGLIFEIPKGYYGEVYNRSGLATSSQLIIVSSRIIDSDYRGEIKIPMKCIDNNLPKSFGYPINKGDRIAQMIIKKYEKVEFKVVGELNETNRGENGFGSTGR